MPSLRRVASTDLAPAELRALRRLLDDAFDGEFADTDWSNSLGGAHVIIDEGGPPLSHASVVARTLWLGGREMRAGYVEAVATRPDSRRWGHATQIMEEVGRVLDEGYELGALSTGVPALYARVGWELWRGPTSARTPDGAAVRTADEDGGIMVLRTSRTGAIDLDAAITCDWRPGDVW